MDSRQQFEPDRAESLGSREIERVLDVLPDGAVRLDRDGRILWCNAALPRLMDKTESLVGHRLSDFFHHACRKGAEGLLDALLAGEDGEKLREFCLLGPQGRPLWVAARAVRSGGSESGPFLLFTDITSWKEAEERFRIAFYTSPDSINLNRLEDGLYVATNEGFTEITGYTEDDVRGKTSLEWGIWENPADRDRLLTLLRAKGRVKNFETRFRMKDGSLRWGLMSANIINYDGVPHILSVVRDITSLKELEAERRNLEAQLQQAQKLEAIGILASGIAHDFNNILTVISGFAELGLLEATEGSETRDFFTEIEIACLRATDLVQQILDFGRKGDSEMVMVPTDPLVVTKEAIRMLRASLPSSIAIETRLPEESSSVLANAGQLHQVMMNLCANAAQAMAGGEGTLTVSMDEVMLSETDLGGVPNSSPGRFVRIGVEDTGGGIEEENLARIFDPFFTTRGAEKGTGLGLSVVHGIVSKHGGVIKVASEVGRGSRFDVFLPVLAGPVSLEQEVPPGMDSLQGSEMLMVVDDETIIVKVLHNFFTALGYQVAGFTSGVQALEAFRAEPEKFRLIITDQTMPDILGADLAAAMLEVRPEVPVLLYTGYSSIVDEGTAALRGIRRFFQKPLPMAEMAKAVRELLDEEKSQLLNR